MRSERRALGLVVIGRNEGERLERCLASARSERVRVVYVDSGSTDGSLELARAGGIDVVELDRGVPFTAARARNAGFHRLRELHPDIDLVQFVDGDCELVPDWLERAERELDADAKLAVVCGRRTERARDASIYNRLCDMEWDTPVGDAESCGGDAMMRCAPFEQVRGFDPTLIAGEEPELCARLRQRGWKIRRIDAPMTRHDAALTRFGQWWTRSVRSGHAAAEGVALHGREANRTSARIVQSAGAWSGIVAAWVVFAALALVSSSLRRPFTVYSATAAALLLVQWVRIARGRRARGNPFGDSSLYAAFCLLGKLPELAGVWRFLNDRLCGRRASLIEYKPRSHSRGGFRVAYLVNQYPKTSHSFIRREIAALEDEGLAIERYSIRRVSEKLIDERDRAEAAKTRVLLDGSKFRLMLTALAIACTRPRAAANALRLALRLGWRSPKGAFYHLVYWIEACTLVRWLEDAGIQHLHAHFATNPATVAALTRELGGPEFSFTFHGPELFDAPNYRALADKVLASRFVVAISDHGKSQLMRWSDPKCWPKLALVHCGLDATFLDAKALPVPDAPRLLCVARLSPEKGHLVLFEAVKRLVAEGVDLEVECLGDGSFRPVLERRIRELGLERVIHLRGWRDNAGVRRAMQDARALVLPSFDEGLPVVFMEAFALERPVIATYIAGIPELVEDGVSGWLAPAGNVERLVEAMRAALALSPAELQAMGARGRARVMAAHSARLEARKLAVLMRGASIRADKRVPGRAQPPLRRSA